MMSHTTRWIVIAACFYQRAVSELAWREVLLEQARSRIQTWYVDPNLMEAPKTRDGVTLRMLKQDMRCGGDMVPVTFAEFDVVGARPVDVFNTMLDTSKQRSWNPQCESATLLGEFPEQGARGWAVTFKIPFVSEREFVQWQVADADFSREEFWLVFSTQSNEDLISRSAIKAGAVAAQNCLGAYHITKTPTGAHVIVTQQVNVHPFLAFPLHSVLDVFPAAWQGTIDFVNQLSQRARQLGLVDTNPSNVVAPAFMLHKASALPAVQTKPVTGFMRAEAFPKLSPSAAAPQASLSPLQWAAVVLIVPACSILVVSIGFGAGRYAARKFQALTGQESDQNEANTWRRVLVE